ncbi:hypothetical protein [Streptomyces violens]|uniref:hypothetical protein n=1 Tax=Streptomyces violens TaxID=66377 RepID=UPI00068BE14A|nr:hypothetical protein [Streptomyces violens]
MISPEKIPTFTGDLAELQGEIISMRRAAQEIRGHGGAVHSRFQRLDAFYQAPEAEQLFATTQAVREKSGDFADHLETVADALAGYADEVAEIVQRLEELRHRATAFVASITGEHGVFFDWERDQDKADEHQALWNGVNAAVAAFQQAEVTAADKITATVGGTQWHINDGSPKQKNAYGFSTDQLAEAESLPWGSPAHYHALPFGIDYHLQEFGVGLYDNVVGSVEGLVNLFSSGEEGDATRESAGKMFLGMESYLLDPSGDRKNIDPNWRRLHAPYRKDAKEFAKSFVAWDDWSTNPAKAFSTVIYNGLTMGAGPLGVASKVGAVGKAGSAARVAGALSKVGEVLDPIGAASKAVGTAARALPKLSEVTAGVRAATSAAAAADIPHSVIELSDGAKVRIEDGKFIPSGKGAPDTSLAPHEPSAAQRTPPVETPREHELVGAGARSPEASAHLGENLPPQASHDPPGGGERSASGGEAGTAHHAHSGAFASADGPDANGAGRAGDSGHHAPDRHGSSGGGDGVPDRSAMSDEEILREQVDRANNDPDWRKQHYYKDGRRRSVEGVDEYGNDLPQLRATGDPDRPFTADKTPPLRAIHHPGKIMGDPATVEPQHVDTLKRDAEVRRHLIDHDMATEKKKLAAIAEYNSHKTPENELAVNDAIREYKDSHSAARDASEDLGEDAAELHAIRDHYPQAQRLDDGARGRYRFDQIWRAQNGRYVVVEAKGSLRAKLGVRNLGTGRDVQQGTPEYFEATLLAMEARGEIDLADELAQAWADGNLDYIEVRANPVGPEYHGYEMTYFNIGRGR